MIFRQGDADLRATAGESATLVRGGSGERVGLRVVLSPAEVGLSMTTVSGAIVQCDRVALISRAECTRRPEAGDVLHVGDDRYEVLRVTGWAYDTSWHVDLTLRR